MSDVPEPVAWWSAKRFAEFAVHVAIFSVLWLSWSRFTGEPAEATKMLVIGSAVAGGLTWGTPLFSRRKASDATD